jgi:hypothetical protein
MAKNATVTNSESQLGLMQAFVFIAYSSAKATLNHIMFGIDHYFAKQVRVNPDITFLSTQAPGP